MFFPGMLFGSMEKWWGKPGLRAASHEGVDFCFFSGKNGAGFRLDETVQVPMIFDGVVVHLMDDFFGTTVVTRHDGRDARNNALLSLYGHLRPDVELRIGDNVRQGEAFAAIADTTVRSSLVPTHLHLTLAAAEALPPPGKLSWEMLNQAKRSVFIDPAGLLDAPYTMMAYDGEINLFKSFIKCGQAGPGPAKE